MRQIKKNETMMVKSRLFTEHCLSNIAKWTMDVS
jgi:hypothetical protein